MKIKRYNLTLPLLIAFFVMISCAHAAGGVTGKVTAEDQTLKTESINTLGEMDGENTFQFRRSGNSDIGQKGGVQKVVVYVSASSSERAPSERQPISIANEGCHFTDAILQMGFVPLAPYTGQVVNPADEEIIPVRCDARAGIRKYFVVLKPAQFFVTGENGAFSFSNLTPGKYTITAWEEKYGSQSQEITISGNETVPANFVFRPRSKT
jgi:hypothetical protein